jgi:hypothetical protein
MLQRTILSSCLLLMTLSAPASSAELDTASFASLHRQIKPQPGESRWMEIPWLIDLHAARRQAAREGKPLFVMSGGGATAIGSC